MTTQEFSFKNLCLNWLVLITVPLWVFPYLAIGVFNDRELRELLTGRGSIL